MVRLKIAAFIIGVLFLAGADAQNPQPPKPGEFPKPYNSGAEKSSSPPKSAAEVAATIKLPPGFKATLFAGEPDVRNPLAMAWDGKGRLWVAENYTYAEQAMRWDLKLRDRIIFFEDAVGDGHFTSRKVFVENLEKLTSVAVGRGGVWAMCPPQLLFIPDKDGDGAPDGPARVVLDGFKVSATGPYHTIANGLRYGPDGWLYGRGGGTNPGDIGFPGTPESERTPLRGTIWRYHPGRKVVEVVSCGTTNPWGHDWDEYGELFFINTTNGHFWHSIAGAHYTRGTTTDPNPRVYQLLDFHADHRRKGGNKAPGLANGHAHVGMTIYQGDNWPADFRGRVFTLNMFGHRGNQEIIERKGSGYVGHEGDDILHFPDPWFRGLEISYGPDGGVFVLDWSDDGEYHERTGVHRDSGRIYKITYGDAKPSAVGDIAKLGIDQLVGLHAHRNEWFPRQAREELITRAGDGRGVGNAKTQLRTMFDKETDVPQKLRELWTLYDLGAADEALLVSLLNHPNEHLRVWGIRLLTDFWPIDNVMSKRPAASVAGPEVKPPPAILEKFTRMAAEDSSGLVRLVLASTLQRLPVAERPKLAAALMAHTEDAADHNQPLIIWYGLIPIADADPVAFASLAAGCELPTTRKFIARRLAEEIDKNSVAVSQLLQSSLAKAEAHQLDIMDGLYQGLKGTTKARKPAAWDAFALKLSESPSAALRSRVRDLGVILGDPLAIAEARRTSLESKADIHVRKAAFESLLEIRPTDLRQLCEQLLTTRYLNPIAARGLATFDDPAIGPILIKAFDQFDPSERGQLVAVLASRPALATALLNAVGDKKIPRSEISAFGARLVRSLNDAVLNKKLAEVWGETRDTPADKQQLIATWKADLTPKVFARADKGQGRLLFTKTCAACHTLYGEGSKIGPDLTGGGRQILDFLLAKIADPSAAVSADYRMNVVELKDGRTVNGIIAAKTDRILTLNTATGQVTYNLADVVNVAQSTQSLMPEGILAPLSRDEVRDLIAYLSYPSQVPLPDGKK